MILLLKQRMAHGDEASAGKTKASIFSAIAVFFCLRQDRICPRHAETVLLTACARMHK